MIVVLIRNFMEEVPQNIIHIKTVHGVYKSINGENIWILDGRKPISLKFFVVC